mgnify:CR=1 FL=1
METKEYDYDWLIRRNPQAQAIRTRKWELKFQGLEADRAVSRGAIGDYLIKLRAPGFNAVPTCATPLINQGWSETGTGPSCTSASNAARGPPDGRARAGRPGPGGPPPTASGGRRGRPRSGPAGSSPR